MKVGDLVRHNSRFSEGYVGIVIRCIPGTDRAKVVQWVGVDGWCSYPERQLAVIKTDK